MPKKDSAGQAIPNLEVGVVAVCLLGYSIWRQRPLEYIIYTFMVGLGKMVDEVSAKKNHGQAVRVESSWMSVDSSDIYRS